MSASSPRRQASAGFSLIELLVALVLVSLLMAGMFNIFKSSASNFQTSLETLGIQRNARWGLAQLQEEILQAGYLIPPRIVGDLTPASDAAQPAILIQATGYTPADAPAPVDEIQVVMDLPINVQGTFTKDTAKGTATADISLPYGASQVLAGDLMFVQDSAFELVRIKKLTAAEAEFDTDAGTLINQYGDDSANSLVRPSFENTHRAGTPFTFVRPLQVVRYTVVPRKLDPSDANAVVPCLVRQTRPLAGNAGAIWAPASGTPVAGEEILLEGVTGFQLDWSVDGGVTWLRGGNNAWKDIRSATSTAVKALTSPVIPPLLKANGLDYAVDPYWFNYTPLLIRVNLETRTRIRRSEYNRTDPTVAAYRTRRETLMLSPRNFALGQP